MAVWSIVNFSALTDDLRMDAEFYRPEYLALDRLLSPERATPWGELPGRFIVGPFGSNFLVKNYLAESPYRYIRGRDVKSFFLIEDQNCFIPQSDFARLNKYHVKPGDLLVSVVGTNGAVAVVTDDIQQAVFSCKSTAYRSDSIDAYYLCAYLNSPNGQAYLARMIRGHVQTGLNLPDLKRVPILRVGPEIEEKISSIVKKAYSTQQQAKELFKQAESDLNAALGIDRLDLASRLFYEDRFSQVASAGRFDAEYFQPRYSMLLSSLKKCPNIKLRTVKELCGRLKYGTSENLPYIEEGTPFLRIADLENKRFELSSVLRIPTQLAKGISEKVSTGDILVSRSGTLGVAVPIEPELDGAVYGSYFIKTHPISEVIDPEYLCMFINSKAGQIQVEMLSTGGIQTNLTINAIESIMVPVGERQWQMGFVELVKKSVSARQESRRLLETAKRAVEIAIEEGEEAARTFLDNEGRA